VCENAQLVLVHVLQNLPVLSTPNCGTTDDPSLGASRAGTPTTTCSYTTLYSRVHEVLDRALQLGLSLNNAGVAVTAFGNEEAFKADFPKL